MAPRGRTHRRKRVRNGYDSNGSVPRPAQAARACSYSEILYTCKSLWTSKALREFSDSPLDGLRMESVFSIRIAQQ
ncbi:hypothetical protein Tco_1327987 [Tanacetum coccineum]